jgi:hypothetical protein
MVRGLAQPPLALATRLRPRKIDGDGSAQTAKILKPREKPGSGKQANVTDAPILKTKNPRRRFEVAGLDRR